MPAIGLSSYNLQAAEKHLIELALREAGALHSAAGLLGVTRHALSRRISKHSITWPLAVGGREQPQ